MSHRPYRPALGIGVAMEEIQKNTGRFYRQEFVDACVGLFMHDHYEINPAEEKFDFIYLERF
jgi:HD-GYP domain-containing protein (c-di-GMP phosphodiesterase class II)